MENWSQEPWGDMGEEGVRNTSGWTGRSGAARGGISRNCQKCRPPYAAAPRVYCHAAALRSLSQSMGCGVLRKEVLTARGGAKEEGRRLKQVGWSVP
jgi:hypothetical protein